MATPYREKIKNRPSPGPVLPFLLPMPLVITLLFSLAKNQFVIFGVSAIAIGMYILSGYFISRSNYYQDQAAKRKWSRPNRTPWRLSAAVFTGGATALVGLLIVKYGLLISVGTGLVAFIGMVLCYGLDDKSNGQDISLSGVAREELEDAFNEAEAKIQSIESAADKVQDAQLSARLKHIATGSRGILDIIAEDPKDLRRARKFLKVYLDGAQKVVNKYVNSDHLKDNKKLEASLNEVLNTIDTVIEEQRVKLLENDVLELDVQIEVLQTQLKHEGIS